MFHLGLADIIQADREREIAELIRQRRLLKPDPDGPDPEKPTERSAESQALRARAQTAGG